jgi:hypothetical protein
VNIPRTRRQPLRPGHKPGSPLTYATHYASAPGKHRLHPIDFKEEVKELAEATDEDLAEATDSVKGETPAALPSARPKDVVLSPETTHERFSKYQELAALNPRAAILVPFADLDSLIRHEFQRRYPEEKPTLSFPRIITVLEGDGVLDPDVSGSLRELRSIRNRAAHEDAELDEDVANYFVKSVRNILGSLLLTGFFKEPPKELEDQSS